MSAELESALVNQVIPVKEEVNPVDLVLPSLAKHLFFFSAAASEAPAAAARSQRPACCSALLQSPPLTHSSKHLPLSSFALSSPTLSLSLSLTKSIQSHRISRRKQKRTSRWKGKCWSSLNAASRHNLSTFSHFTVFYVFNVFQISLSKISLRWFNHTLFHVFLKTPVKSILQKFTFWFITQTFNFTSNR